MLTRIFNLAPEINFDPESKFELKKSILTQKVNFNPKKQFLPKKSNFDLELFRVKKQ